MLFEQTNVLRGPNYWSARHHHIIVMTLNLNSILNFPISRIHQFCQQVVELFPSLDNHPLIQQLKTTSSSADVTAPFAQLLGNVAVTMQQEVGIQVLQEVIFLEGRGQRFYIGFLYDNEESGRMTAIQTEQLTEALLDGNNFDKHTALQSIHSEWELNKLGPSSYSLVAEAKRRDIPVVPLDDYAYMQLGYGCHQKRIEATIANTTGCIAVDKAGNKHETKRLLADACVPVPAGKIIADVAQIATAIRSIGFPLVVKPLDGNQGKGATININTEDEAIQAFHRARIISKKVVIEKYISGFDFRALVVGYKFVAAAKRTPAAVTGDGQRTIQQLVDEVNKDPRRGEGHANVLTAIKLDACVVAILAKKGYTTDSIPSDGEVVYLKETANLSTGGTAEDVTDRIHPHNRSLFERIARNMGLDICGIDIMATDLETPIVENGGAVIEVNAAPGFRMHLEPAIGQPRNVAGAVMDMLFPEYSECRIPIIAITGTNGKTTTTRLVACMAQQAGFNTGYTTTDGIYLNKERIYKGDCSGPGSAKVILKDPAVEFAVLEAARGGILRSGLGFDKCDCAIVTNVAEDHLGLNGIDTLDQLARVKKVVAQSVQNNGYEVLNADDDRVYAMKDDLDCQIALFSLYPESARIQRHCEAGGIAAICDEGYVMIRVGNRIIPVEQIENIPLTHGGKAKFNVANVLGATLAAYVTNLALPAIRCSLRNFNNTHESTPGRQNIFQFNDYKVMMDYAHNPHGVRALGEFINNMEVSYKIGVITGVGDRRNEDIIALGEEAAKIFDTIIIRYDEDLRGRTDFEIGSLLRSGIQKVNPNKHILHSAGELEAIDLAMAAAVQNAIVVVLVENVDSVFHYLKEAQQSNTGVTQKTIREAV